jgi:hypothetical protein
MYCAQTTAGLLMAASMVPKLQGPLGQRIKQAYRSRGWSRMDFWRRVHAVRPNIIYGQIIKWEKGVTPEQANLHALAEASGYAVSDFTDGHGYAHPVMSDSGGRDAITRLMQSGELAPFSNEDMKFLESCVAAEPTISKSKLHAGLLGFRLALAADSDEAAHAEYVEAVRRMRSTSSFPPAPSKPESTSPKPLRRPRGR